MIMLYIGNENKKITLSSICVSELQSKIEGPTIQLAIVFLSCEFII